MSISIGDTLPEATFRILGSEGIEKLSTDDIFAKKKVVLFAVPGAFTPTCHLKHLPGFIDNAAAFKQKGVDTVACVAVNDPFVLDAWAKASDGAGKVLFLSDGNAEFTKEIGHGVRRERHRPCHALQALRDAGRRRRGARAERRGQSRRRRRLYRREAAGAALGAAS